MTTCIIDEGAITDEFEDVETDTAAAVLLACIKAAIDEEGVSVDARGFEGRVTAARVESLD